MYPLAKPRCIVVLYYQNLGRHTEGLYIPQCEGAKDLFFKCGWRSVVEQLGCGPETEVYNAPQYFIPASLAEYAASVQQ